MNFEKNLFVPSIPFVFLVSPKSRLLPLSPLVGSFGAWPYDFWGFRPRVLTQQGRRLVTWSLVGYGRLQETFLLRLLPFLCIATVLVEQFGPGSDLGFQHEIKQKLETSTDSRQAFEIRIAVMKSFVLMIARPASCCGHF